MEPEEKYELLNQTREESIVPFEIAVDEAIKLLTRGLTEDDQNKIKAEFAEYFKKELGKRLTITPAFDTVRHQEGVELLARPVLNRILGPKYTVYPKR